MERLFSRRKSASGAAALLLLALTACKDEPVTPDPVTPDPTTPEQPPVKPEDWEAVRSAIAKDPAIEAKVAALVQAMTVEEKVGQLVQAEINAVSVEDIKQYHLGSVLNGGGSFPNGDKASSVADWYTLADKLWEASMDPTANPRRIPLIWGTDAVHGHNNVKGATFFPQNIGLGAANDPELMRRIGEVTAREVARTGIDWAFAPTIAVVRDSRWGRTYEGYSEDPAIVESYAGKIVEGLQGQLAKDATTNERVIATAKHFLGDGATTQGVDQGVSELTEKELRDIHGRGYVTALRAGAQTVMASYNSWKDTAQGNNAKAYKMHGNKYLLTDVLKTKMGFDGFVISDWNGLGQIKMSNSDAPRDCSNDDCAFAIAAGVDMAMIPTNKDWKTFIANTLAAVKSGELSKERLDDAVTRILRVKFRAGLFDKPKPSARVTSHDIGTAEHRAVAREAVRKSLVLLKNNDGVLPLARSAKVLVTGKSADSLANQSGGWSISWQGRGHPNEEFGGGTTLWQAVKNVAPQAVLDVKAAEADYSAYDVAIVAVGELPYAEGQGDLKSGDTFELFFRYPADNELIASLKAKGVKKIVTVLYSGRPLYVNKELNQSDAFVAAWLPGTEGDGMADVLFRKADGTVNYDFQGKLSYSWPKSPCQAPLHKGMAGYDPLFAFGYGQTYARTETVGALEAPTRTYGCLEEPPTGDVATVALPLFNAGNVGKWVMRLGAPSNWGGTEVAQGTNATTSLAPNEIKANPVDYKRQWDSAHVTWSGTGQVYMQNQNGDETTDLTPYLNSKGALVFEVKVDKAPTEQVNLSVHCKHPCLGEIQLTSTLRGLAGQGWSEVAVPLKCFLPDLKFKYVNTPFLLYTSGPMELTLANIRWEAQYTPNVACEGGTTTPATSISADRELYKNGVWDSALFDKPTGWVDRGTGKTDVDAAFDIGGGEKVIDVKMSGHKESGGNGGFAFGVKSPNLLDVTPIASTGGVEFELRVLDYGQTTQDFWVKNVCQRKAGTCNTGDLKTLIGHPAVGEWKTVRMPYASASYPAAWDKTQVSSAFEMLPAWDDQAGSIHFQIRNVNIKKQLVP